MSNVYLKKKIYIFHTEISPHFNCFSSMKGWILVFIYFFIKIKMINNADLFPQPFLVIFFPRVAAILTTCESYLKYNLEKKALKNSKK